MRAIILAAGVGRRIGGEEGHPPKCLLKFNGKTLLQRHLELLRQCGVRELAVAVGFKSNLVQNELDTLGADGFAKTVFNPRFEEGSNLTLWAMRDEMTRGGDVLLMDADVLYDYRMLLALTRTSIRNCFLMDRNFEPGDEPVKLCVKDGRLVEFRKRVEAPYDFCGESVGFFRLEESMCRTLMESVERFTAQPEECYEEALRAVLLASPQGLFGYEDVSDLPWTEIDFPEDVDKARDKILPLLREPGHE